MLLVTGWLSESWNLGFTVSGFWAAFFGGLVVGLVSLVLSFAQKLISWFDAQGGRFHAVGVHIAEAHGAIGLQGIPEDHVYGQSPIRAVEVQGLGDYTAGPGALAGRRGLAERHRH